MSALSKVLDNPQRVELLLVDLLKVLQDAQKASCDGWDMDQRTNRAVMIEESSVFFSVLSYFTDNSASDRESLFESFLSELDDVDSDILCDCSLLFLQAGNKMKSSSTLESILVKDILLDLDQIKKDMSKSEKRIIVSFFQSEQFLYLLKDKFGHKLPLLINELTCEGSIYRKHLPSWLLLSLETLSAGTRLWSALTSWTPNLIRSEHSRVAIARPVKRVHRSGGIDIGREKRIHRPGGIHIGPPLKRIEFKVHNETTLWTNILKYFT